MRFSILKKWKDKIANKYGLNEILLKDMTNKIM